MLIDAVGRADDRTKRHALNQKSENLGSFGYCQLVHVQNDTRVKHSCQEVFAFIERSQRQPPDVPEIHLVLADSEDRPFFHPWNTLSGTVFNLKKPYQLFEIRKPNFCCRCLTAMFA